MRANWAEEARAFIRDATAELPEDADLTARRAALRKVAGEFHCGTSWGKKVWSREVRKYLERHGLPPIHPLGTARSAQHIRLASPDIIFPYRDRP